MGWREREGSVLLMLPPNNLLPKQNIKRIMVLASWDALRVHVALPVPIPSPSDHSLNIVLIGITRRGVIGYIRHKRE